MNKSLYVHYWIHFRIWEIILNPVSKIWIFTGLGSAVVVELKQSEHLKFVHRTGVFICRCLWKPLAYDGIWHHETALWIRNENTICAVRRHVPLHLLQQSVPAITTAEMERIQLRVHSTVSFCWPARGAAVEQHWMKLWGSRVQGGLVDPCRGSTMFPPSSSITSCRGHLFVVCLLAAEPTERQVGLL